jgi:putative SOS response-associated peptidase YedK
MCGRYERHSDKQKIAEAFRVGKLPPGFELPPDYNVAPSTFQPVIGTDRESGERERTSMRWDLCRAKIADPRETFYEWRTNFNCDALRPLADW